jgi:UDP-2,3-diacylglucosamine pyrophosphatase LpxH
MSKLTFISDLHIKPKDQANNFMLSDDQFLDFLKKTLETSDHIYLVGDVFEAQQSLAYPTEKKQVTEIIKSVEFFNKSFDFILKHKDRVHLLWGNHDRILSNPENQEEIFGNAHAVSKSKCIQLGNDQGCIFITHGEEDYYKTWFGRFLEFGTWLGGNLERLFARKLFGVKNMSRQDNKHKKNKKQYNYLKNRSDYPENCKYLITGHTHDPQVQLMHDGVVHLNTGMFDGFTNYVTSIDTNTMNISQYNRRIL